MSDHDVLFWKALTDPDDALARLAYADWCEENGHPDVAAAFRAWKGPRSKPWREAHFYEPFGRRAEHVESVRSPHEV